MTYECKYLVQGRCIRRDQSCDPGDKGCILLNRYAFPLREKKSSKSPKSAPGCAVKESRGDE